MRTLVKAIAFFTLTCFALMLQGCTGVGNPYKSDEKIRQDWLRITPLGSTFEEVKAALKKRRIGHDTRAHGFRRRDQKSIGATSIEAHLATYPSGIIYRTQIMGFWGFDAEGKLIEISIWKETDGL